MDPGLRRRLPNLETPGQDHLRPGYQKSSFEALVPEGFVLIPYTRKIFIQEDQTTLGDISKVASILLHLAASSVYTLKEKVITRHDLLVKF